jgi:hypothetical protein
MIAVENPLLLSVYRAAIEEFSEFLQTVTFLVRLRVNLVTR